MGMFAYVDYHDHCQCGADINEWQTKDVDGLYLQTVTPVQIGNGEMVSVCPGCRTTQHRYVRPAGVIVTSQRPE